MADASSRSDPEIKKEASHRENAAHHPAPAASRTTLARKSGKASTATKPRTTRKKKGPTAADLAALEALRAELAAARGELEGARREVAEVVAACREAESRVSATRADADAIRRVVSEVDVAATSARGAAEAARAQVDRAEEASGQTEQSLVRLQEWLTQTRAEFATLEEESRRTLDSFRAAVEELRAAPSAADGVLGGSGASIELPEVPVLPAEERAEDIRERLAHLLNDAWMAEKEQVGFLKTLADECGDRDVRVLLEEHRAACQRRQETVEKRLNLLGAKPSGGRRLLGHLATRVWEAVQAPHDHADQVVLSLLKAISAAEFQAGLYAAAHAYAHSAGGTETAEEVAGFFREERQRADRLRAALAPVVGRAARR